MACCAPTTDIGAQPRDAAARQAEEIRLASRATGGGLVATELSVPSAHCGACIAAIEGALARLDGVVDARLNLSTKRAVVRWRTGGPVPPFVRALAEVGHEANLSSLEESQADPELRRLVRATAVAGFAAMNIMLMSISVWAGAGDATRQAFHMVSAFLALPAVAYSGRIFFLSAWSALRAGRTNMDVPISVGILLALALSLHDTYRSGPHAYFDAATTLIFFLLIGRTVDFMMRRRARMAVLGLARMMPRGATVVAADGTEAYKLQAEIQPGERVVVAPGDRIPLDGTVESGTADVDAALVTGEAAPIGVRVGCEVLSGMLNLNGSLLVRVTKAANASFMSEMIRMMESAEHGRARYTRLADRVASFYSPVVHALAAAAFLGWMVMTGDWHRSITVAISVLIITCPCALGLAVPMVQAVAARRLFERGIALKDGNALERLAQVDTVVFDKTGTLTLGELQVAGCTLTGSDLDAVAALAGRSRHPVARAVAALGRGHPRVEDFREWPGQGTEGRIGGALYRLGRPEWASPQDPESAGPHGSPCAAVSRDGAPLGLIKFTDAPRPRGREAVNALFSRGLRTELLSGDRHGPVSATAASFGIEGFGFGVLPSDKVRRLEELRGEGRRTLMVGDGLNDAPALSAAYVAMAPGSAADVGRSAADLVFLAGSLTAVPEAIAIAGTAGQLIRQNLTLAVAYNLLVIPVALAGHVTPLMAAVAMSASSILVVGNALRFPKFQDCQSNSEERGPAMPAAVEQVP